MPIRSCLVVALLSVSLGLLSSCAGSGNPQSSQNSPTPGTTPPPSNFQLTLSFTGNGTGAVVSKPAGISCRTGNTTGCLASFTSGASVKLTVTPDSAMVFGGWKGGPCSGAAPNCTFNISANTQVVATLTKAPPPPPANAQLTLIESGGGQGSVVSAPAGISCPGTCTAAFPQGTQITLTATAQQGSSFVGYSGACTTQGVRPRTRDSESRDAHKRAAAGAAGSCTFAATGSESVTAAFTTLQAPPPPPPTSSLSISVNGSGSVVSDPPGIDCPKTCSANFDQGTTVTLTPSADAGWQFNFWTGGTCGSSGYTCQVVTTSASQSFSATFQSLNLNYLGGPIVPATSTQVIFWGVRWSDPTFVADKITGMDSWYQGVGGSSYGGSVDEYTDVSGQQVTAASTYQGHLVDNSVASDTGAVNEACTMAKNLAENSFVGVYLDETRPANACAWHTYATCPNNSLQIEVAVFYDLDGDQGCDPNDTFTSHSQGLAAIANVSGHEFSEARTDPELTSWLNPDGEEAADLCEWMFPDPFVTFSNGSQWRIQANWSNYANNNGLGQENGGCIDFNIMGQ